MKNVLLEENSPLFPLYWIGISVILLAADYFSGPFIQFPITFLIPVALASWYSGVRWGVALGILLPICRLFFNIMLWTVPWGWIEAGFNCLIRIFVFVIFAVLIDHVAKERRKLTREVQMLSGLLPICSNCKKIRDESNQWQPIEHYITERSAASFTHGMCPDCAEKLYGTFLKDK